MAWLQFCKGKKDLSGNGGIKKSVTLDELAEHHKESDAWTSVRGGSIIYAALQPQQVTMIQGNSAKVITV